VCYDDVAVGMCEQVAAVVCRQLGYRLDFTYLDQYK
jgi:hypothetical protein